MSSISAPKLTSPLPAQVSQLVSSSPSQEAATSVAASSPSVVRKERGETKERSKEKKKKKKKPIRICVFCSTQRGADPVHVAAATRLAQVMHEHRSPDSGDDDGGGIQLVYGGGSTGLMGAVARERVRLGGPDAVIGVVPYALVETERGGRGKEGIPGVEDATNTTTPDNGTKPGPVEKIKGMLRRRAGKAPSSSIDGIRGGDDDGDGDDDDDDDGNNNINNSSAKEPWETWADVCVLPTDAEYGRAIGLSSLARRKAAMTEMVRQGAPGSGFIALPGGFGSLDEVLTVLTARQLGFHSSPMVLCNVAGFWDGLTAWMRDAGDMGFLGAESRGFVKVVDTVEEAVAYLVGG